MTTDPLGPPSRPAPEGVPAPSPTDPGRTEPGSPGASGAPGAPASDAARDIADVPAVEIVSAAAIHLMSAAAVKCGLAEDEDAAEHKDLDEARTLITALAGLVTAAAPALGHHHAAPLRDGLRSLQLAFREASLVPDAPGEGPGEKLTGPVYPRGAGR
ncbi:DUF1844 domain-containing protein [Motilibacter deserti]|uniref:DUF1844 domain-containing protein n=1 Tax=Motilibacter deserti TaxID=2714956 RepID=UPI002F2B640A